MNRFLAETITNQDNQLYCVNSNLLHKYRDWWTRTFARLRYGGVTDEMTVAVRSTEKSVYCVSSGSSLIGQKTPGASTIIINRTRFDKLPELSAIRAVEHEIGHQKRHPLLGAILWSSIIIMAIGIVFLVLLLISIGITDTAAGSNWKLIVTLIGFVSLGPFAIRLDELAAELHVLDHMSSDEYLKADEMMPEINDISAISVLFAKIIYVE